MFKFSPLGALQLAGAQVVIGLNLVMAKSMLPHLSVFIILFFRFGFGCIIGLLFNWSNNHTLLNTEEGNRLNMFDHLSLWAQAITAGFLFNVLALTGMQFTSAATAGLITSIIPAAIAGLSVIFLKEHMNASRLISIVLAVCGLVILNIDSATITIDTHGRELLGEFIILLSVLPEAIFTILAKMHRTPIGSLNKVIYMNIYNFVLFIPIFIWYILARGWPDISGVDWLKLGVYGINSVLFFLLWYKGLDKTPALISGLYTALAPCATIVLAYFFLHEPIRPMYILTFIFIFASIVIGSGLLKRKPFLSIF